MQNRKLSNECNEDEKEEKKKNFFKGLKKKFRFGLNLNLLINF